MTARRLIAASHIERWEFELRKAVTQAMDKMRGHVHTNLAAHGIHVSLTAAGNKKNNSAPAPPPPWSDAAWAAAVTAAVTPVANSVGAQATTAAKASVPTQLSWGMTSSAPTIAAGIVAGAIAAGAYLGSRLNANVASASDPAQAADDVFATADDIVGNVVGAGANAMAQAVATDVTSYVAGYFGDVYSDATRSWENVGDDKVRESHLDVDDVGLNEPFQVGADSLMFPGDPSGSDEEVEGCRCWIEVNGLDPGNALYGTDEEAADQNTVGDLNQAARATDTGSTPRSYPT